MSERYTSLLVADMKKRLIGIGDDLWLWVGEYATVSDASKSQIVRKALRELRARVQRKKVRR